MAVEPGTFEPEFIIRGDTVSWTVGPFTEFPPETWTLTYAFARLGAAPLVIVGTNNGDGRWLVTLTSANTTALAAGVHAFQAKVSLAGAEYTKRSGRLTVVDELESLGAGGIEPRSHNRRMLDAIEALMEGRAVDGVQSFTIAGRSVDMLSGEELRTWLTFYQQRVKAEEQADRINRGEEQNRHRVVVRFTA